MAHVLTEANFSDVDTMLVERDNGENCWIIEGVFLQADVINRNHRIYPSRVLQQKVQEYKRDFVEQRRAVGELSHPSTTEINLDKITHLIESIREDGTNYIGRARILNTPTGNIVQGLLEGGVKLGVSSRAVGSVKQNGRGVNEVQEDLQIAAIDIVYQPSAPDAFVEGIMEGANFVWDTTPEDQEFAQQIYEDIQNTKSSDLEERKLQAFQAFLNQISRNE